jgi:ABC-2 type transport system ATP-binding protein
VTTLRLAVEVEGLCKRYGNTVAADDVSFQVHEGEIFGLLGPNGAGKTTVIECLGTLRHPDGGRLRVLGLDPQRDARALRERIGIQLQAASLQERIKLWEVLDLFSSLYARGRDWKAMVTDFDLSERLAVPFGRLSGGEKQRALIVLALINDPEIVFLDELTTSLDPHARRAMWNVIRRVRERGTTVLLTTHFMDEAERLCDRIAVMRRGKIVALDSPDGLVRKCRVGLRLSFSTREPFDIASLVAVAGVERVERLVERVIVHGRGSGFAADVLAALTEARVQYADVRTEQPSLEDAFLELAGEPLLDGGLESA